MKRKRKKAFVITRVKSKLVFLPPKKFWGKKITGVFFLILGSAILTASIFLFFIIPTFVKQECFPATMPAEELDIPKRLFIPKLDLDLPLTEAKIVEGKWPLTKEDAFYLPEPAVFKKGGNIVIFGSNQTKVLGSLTKIKKGDEIYVFGERQYLIFVVAETKTAEPSDLDIFLTTTEKTLTIFSTNDYLNGIRFVVKAVEK